MSTTHDRGPDSAQAGSNQPEPVQDGALYSAPPTTEGWTPEDKAPSAAENNFLSFALFGFLILFGIGCFILF